MTRTQAKSRAGFTLIEVMMAITVLMIGASALFTMLPMATGAVTEARRVTTATTANRRMLERLQLMSLQWGPQSAALLDWYDQVPDAAGDSTGWFTPETTADYNARTNWWGRSGVNVFSSAAPYCTQINMTRLGGNTQAVRVDVRTWWTADHTPAGTAADFACGADAASAQAATAELDQLLAAPALKAVYSSTVIREAG